MKLFEVTELLEKVSADQLKQIKAALKVYKNNKGSSDKSQPAGTGTAANKDAGQPKGVAGSQDAGQPKGTAANKDAGQKVEPRPSESGQIGDYARAAWDKKYAKTNNPDGTPKKTVGVAANKDAGQPKGVADF